MNHAIVLACFAASGFSALVYEVAWTRSLSLILGSNTYALSTMLSAFMAGLALGSWLGGKAADRPWNMALAFGLAELGIGIFGLLTVPLMNVVPNVYFVMFKKFQLVPAFFFAVQFILCAGIMIVPTTLMGATFPLVSRIATASLDRMGKGVGGAYSANTVGAIAGSAGAGFFLIPALGVKMTTITAACVNLGVAVIMIALSRAGRRGLIAAAGAAFFAASAVAAVASEEERWLVNYYLADKVDNYVRFNQKEEKELYFKHGREGTVRAWRNKEGLLMLQVSGKIEGTADVDYENTLLLSYLPIASRPRTQNALVIGLGAGVTLKAAKEHVPDVTLVEINPSVVEAIRLHGEPGLLDGVNIEINDARNYLLRTEKKFDMITSEPSYPTEASTGNLFTKEFFELSGRRLAPSGVFCQWLPYYQLSNDDITIMIRTFGGVFKYAYLWKVPMSLDLLLVGSNEPFAFDAVEIEARTKALNRSGLPLMFVLSRTPEQVADIVRNETAIPINTDDRPVIEFHAARNMITGVKD